MAIIEGVMTSREGAEYRVTFLRFGRNSHIEIFETVHAVDAEEAHNIAFGIAEKTKWHVERIERVNETPLPHCLYADTPKQCAFRGT